jgi:hypothetical protein
MSFISPHFSVSPGLSYSSSGHLPMPSGLQTLSSRWDGLPVHQLPPGSPPSRTLCVLWPLTASVSHPYGSFLSCHVCVWPPCVCMSPEPAQLV